MKRFATFSISVANPARNKRVALSEKEATEERLAVDPDKLYFTLDALHYEQKGPATTEEKKLYGRDRVYSGNSNGDFFEGGRNCVWACSNPECTNKFDKKWRQGTRRFLKYKDKATCPHCGSDKIFNWEKETFQTEGELLARNQDGKYRYETWKGEPVNLNHDDKKVIGHIEDVWIDPPKEAIVELISIDKRGEHDNERVARKIEAGQIDSGSMELLTGIGMCSLCFNVHTSEDEFCDHLENEKGLVNQRTGMHVFEICKAVQGCGHAICTRNDPADSGALVREVFAQKNEQGEDPSTNFNSNTSSMPSIDGKPDFSDIKAAQTKKASRTVDASRSNVPGAYETEKPLPDLKDMGVQLKAFGNYDSRRSAEQIRRATMTPAEIDREERFAAWEKSQLTGTAATISNQPTLRISKEFLKNTFRQAVATKKIKASSIREALMDFNTNRKAFTESLKARTLNSNSLSRLAIRKAQMKEDGDVQEMVLDLLGDALIAAGESAKAIVTDVSYEDAGNALDESVGEPSDSMDFEESLEDKPEEHEDHEPSMHHEAPENKDEEEEHSPEADEDKTQDEDNLPMKKEAAAGIWPEGPIDTEKFPESTGVNKPEKLAKENGAGTGYTSTPKTEDFPKNSKQDKNPKVKGDTTNVTDGAALQALTRRKASLIKAIEEGTGDLDVLLPELKKVEAQLDPAYPKFDTEKFPETGKDLGGAINKNPAPVIPNTLDDQAHMKTEVHSPDSDNLGGAIDENPKPIRMASLLKAASIPTGFKVANLSQVQKNSIELQCIKAGLITADKKVIAKGVEGVSPQDIKQLKEMGILPKDFKAGQLKTEEFPTSKEGAQVPHLHEDNFGETEDFPDASKNATETLPLKTASDKRTAEPTKPYDDKKFQEEKGIGVKTPKLDMYEHTVGTPTKDTDADKKLLENQGKTKETKPGEAMKEMDAELDRKDGKEPEDKMDSDLGAKKINPEISDKEQDEHLGKLTPTKPNAAMHEMEKYRDIKATSKLTAEFKKVEAKNQATASNWTVFENDEPIFRVALKTAYPREVVARYNDFASEEYGDTLISELKGRGIKAVNKRWYGEAGVTFTDSERKAMRKASISPDVYQPKAGDHIRVTIDNSHGVVKSVGVAEADIEFPNGQVKSIKISKLRKAQSQTPASTSAQTNQPANVDPAVADKIMNDAKPGISVLDLVASLAAPIIAESDTLSVTTFLEEFVNLGQSQDKVTELTTKLNQNVENLKQQSGLPEEPDSGTSPAVGEAPPAPNPNPQMAQASRTIGESEKKYAMKLQELRITPIVREEQACGLIDNYNSFLRAGCTKREAATESRRVAEERVQELISIPEEAYLVLEKQIKGACRMARSKVGNLPGAERDASLKKARWEAMQTEASVSGSRVIKHLPGPFTEAATEMKRHAGIGGLKFKSAHGVDAEKVEAALKARDNRDGRKARDEED
jgi:hypothetical protein